VRSGPIRAPLELKPESDVGVNSPWIASWICGCASTHGSKDCVSRTGRLVFFRKRLWISCQSASERIRNQE